MTSHTQLELCVLLLTETLVALSVATDPVAVARAVRVPISRGPAVGIVALVLRLLFRLVTGGTELVLGVLLLYQTVVAQTTPPDPSVVALAVTVTISPRRAIRILACRHLVVLV
jgi:hypothetical protein